MSNNRLELQGMEEFKTALRNLPRELAVEAAGIVSRAAEEAKGEIVGAYPTVEGNLKQGVKVTTEASPFGSIAIVRSTARHAHLYEFGTQVRRNDIGANRGAMPGRPTVVPIVMRKRREMYASLKSLLQRAGFQVSGDA